MQNNIDKFPISGLQLQFGYKFGDDMKKTSLKLFPIVEIISSS